MKVIVLIIGHHRRDLKLKAKKGKDWKNKVFNLWVETAARICGLLIAIIILSFLRIIEGIFFVTDRFTKNT